MLAARCPRQAVLADVLRKERHMLFTSVVCQVARYCLSCPAAAMHIAAPPWRATREESGGGLSVQLSVRMIVVTMLSILIMFRSSAVAVSPLFCCR